MATEALKVEASAVPRPTERRLVSVLFGDGAAAVVLQASEAEEGLIGETLGCIADPRHALRVRGIGGAYVNAGILLGDTYWDFNGQEIFKRAVKGMVAASKTVMAKYISFGLRTRCFLLGLRSSGKIGHLL